MRSIESKRILVCGATGFIGRNIVQGLINSGCRRVLAVSHSRSGYDIPGVEWVNADLANREDVDRVMRGVDILIQAAATTSGSKDIIEKPYIHTTDNAVMNSLILRSAYDHKVEHFVFFSCTVMYQSSEVAVREVDFSLASDLGSSYFGSGWTKVYIEKMCEFYSRISDTRFTVIRHSNIYGPHDKFDLERSHVFGATVTKVLAAPDNGEVAIWGTGEEGRDLLYVDDLVDFVDLALHRQESRFGLYNVGSGQAIKVKDLVKKIILQSGRELSITYDFQKPTIPATVFLDCTRAFKQFGWQPQHNLTSGINLTLTWWKENIGPANAMDENR